MKPPKETTESPFQAAWWKSPGVVYFIGAGNPALAIKIGVAAVTIGQTIAVTLRRRLREIQTSNHERVELLGIISFTEGEYPTRLAEVLERELHIRFAKHQRFAAHKRAAEWFSPSPEILTYIKDNAQAPEVLGAPRFVSGL